MGVYSEEEGPLILLENRPGLKGGGRGGTSLTRHGPPLLGTQPASGPAPATISPHPDVMGVPHRVKGGSFERGSWAPPRGIMLPGGQMGHPAFPHLQRSTASCLRSRSRTAQPTTSPPATTWWTSACRPPLTDRNPASCSVARTCERPAPPPERPARPHPPPALPRAALPGPALSVPP